MSDGASGLSSSSRGVTKKLLVVFCTAAVISIPLIVGNRFVLHIAVMTAIMAIVAISMNLMLRIGQLSFAQIAFMGIGAYSSALFAMRMGVPTSVSFPLGGVVPTLIALALGPIFLRIRGVYFVLLTFAFGQIVNLTLQEWVSLFGGNNGLMNIPKLEIFGYRFVSVGSFYTISVILLVIVYALVEIIHRSNLSAVLSTLEDNEPLGRSLGLDAMRWRNGIFGLSAFFAGLAGSLYAHYLGFLSPQSFSFWVTVDALVMNVIGGVAIPFGPILGAILIVPLPELLRDAKQFELLIYAAILAGSLFFFQDGILGYVVRLLRRSQR